MFCPQCGTESPADLKFCRTCGSNLKVIGKAVTLSEAIARSDGIPAKLKDIFSNIKVAQVTDDVAYAMEKLKTEITTSSEDHRRAWAQSRQRRREKRRQYRRERHLTRGFVTMFSGIGLGTFLYFLGHSIVLKLPPDAIARIPFDLDSVIRVIWLIGLIPALSGFGRILAGLMTPREQPDTVEFPAPPPLRIDPVKEGSPFAGPRHSYGDEVTIVAPESVTDRTTNILDHQPQVRETDEIN